MLVSFIIVALNIGDKLKDLINDIKKQDYDHHHIEIIFVDSKSNDNTKNVMYSLARSNHGFSRVCVLDNPNKILPCGWNIALKASRGDVILRVDAHSSIPPNFISKNMNWIKKGEKIVGGHRISIIDENSSWQKTLLVAETSLFGSGIASYRRTKVKKYVSTLAHAAYSREVFQRVGGYDERLERTEDNEIHYRMKVAGYDFWLDPEIQSFHYARNTFRKMLKQKLMNGYWIGLTLGISPKCFSVYHFMPFMFVIAIIGGIVLNVLGITLPIIVLATVYIVFNIINTIASIADKKFELSYVSLPLLFFLLHIYYGVGTLKGIIKLYFWKHDKANFQCLEIDNIKKSLSV